MYLITSSTSTGPAKSVTRRQQPAAWRAFESAVYDIVKGHGGLDTQWGVDAQTEARDCLIRGMQKRGKFGNEAFSPAMVKVGSCGTVTIIKIEQ